MSSRNMYIYTFKIYLTPLQDIVFTNFTGTITLSMILNLLDKVRPGLSEQLHSTRRPKPYSVTPLFLRSYPLTGIKPVVARAQSTLWFRVSVVGDLGLDLLNVLSSMIGEVVELFQIRARAVISNVEAQVRSIESLFSPGSTVFRVKYLTPTRFALKKPRKKDKARYSFCPEAWRIVKSTLRHWREHVDTHVSEGLVLWTYQNVVIMDFGPAPGLRSNVVTVRLPRGGVARGYVGFALYRVLGKDRENIRRLWALLRYAELMNVGTGKSMGLGVIQLEELEERNSRKVTGEDRTS